MRLFLLSAIVMLGCAGCASDPAVERLKITPVASLSTATPMIPVPVSPTITTLIPPPTSRSSVGQIAAAPQPTELLMTPTSLPTAAPTIVTSTPQCFNASGQIVHDEITSVALSKQQSYRVYLPPCYSTSVDQRYPVIYLLHGAGHSDGYWDSLGVDEMANQLITIDAIAPVIIVMPDGNRTFGPTQGDPPPFAAFVHDELIPHIDITYRTMADRNHRAIGGISLGGAWALILAVRYPESFTAVGGHSPAIGSFNQIWPDPATLAANHLRVYLDVGDDDSLIDPTRSFDQELTRAKAIHELHIFPGSHIETYWTSHLEEYLRFYTDLWNAVYWRSADSKK